MKLERSGKLVYDGLKLSLEDPKTKIGKVLQSDRMTVKYELKLWLLWAAIELPMSALAFIQDCASVFGHGGHIAVYMALNVAIWIGFLRWLAHDYRAKFTVFGIDASYLRAQKKGWELTVLIAMMTVLLIFLLVFFGVTDQELDTVGTCQAQKHSLPRSCHFSRQIMFPSAFLRYFYMLYYFNYYKKHSFGELVPALSVKIEH